MIHASDGLLINMELGLMIVTWSSPTIAGLIRGGFSLECTGSFGHSSSNSLVLICFKLDITD